MTIANVYRKLKQILVDSNVALTNRGLNTVNSLNGVSAEIAKLGDINRLPYLLRKEIVEITQDDLDGVTDLDVSIFGECYSLISIKIPNSVTNINYSSSYMFERIDIYLYSTIPPTLHSDYAFCYCTIHVPMGSGDAYKSATNWSSLADNIIEDIVV